MGLLHLYSIEIGSTFRSQMPKFPTDDPHYRIIRRRPSRFLHYYFYIRDPVIGHRSRHSTGS